MLTRTLATLSLLLTFGAGADPLPSVGHQDGARAARRARVLDLDDVGGCRAPAPTPVSLAPASCIDEGRP